MCEIFPEVEKCCFCINHRVAMLLISVLSVMSGVLILSCIERESSASFDKFKNITDLQHIQSSDDAMGKIGQIVPAGITFMAGLFMFNGLVLLFATISDQEGFVQVFVWATFVNIVIGFFLVIGVGFECVLDSKLCLLKSMDWLSSATALVCAVFYLCLWIYFISVCNTYVISVFR